jgi:hypothetical protein
MKRASGMTIVELMASIAIFLALAGMVLQVMGGGLDLWSGGERGREVAEQADVLLDRLAEELRHVVSIDGGTGEPAVKFYADFVEADPDGDGIAQFRAQRLLYVRRLFEASGNPLLRQAGRVSGGQAFFTGQSGFAGPGSPAAGEAADPAESLRATGGLLEVALVPAPDPRDEYRGRLVLWRAMRSPIGGVDSLFRSLEDRDGGLREEADEALAENLLYLGFEFFSGEDDVAAAVGEESGPSSTWDSTRGILPAGEDSESFRLGRGPSSLEDPDDDVFPRAVRITVVVEAPPEDSYRAVLLQDLGRGDVRGRCRVQGGRFLEALGDGSHLVRLGHEWVEIAASNGQEIQITARGRLGTTPADHAEGTLVQVGHRFQRTVFLPTYREDLNRVPRLAEAME